MLWAGSHARDESRQGDGPIARQPHVILIVSDQHNRKVMGCAGDVVIRTPNLDRLAGDGAILRSAYAPSPLCVPSRMAMLSGLPPVETGIHHNSQTLPSHIPTFAHSLTAAGYRSVLCGRMHFLGPDQRHGFRERLVGDHGPTGTAHTEAAMGIFDGTTAQDGRALAKSGAGWSTVQAYDRAVTDAALRRIAQHDSEAPLFMTVGFYGPHNPYVCTAEQFDHYSNALEPLTDEGVAEWRQLDHPAMRTWRESRRLPEADIRTLNTARAAYYGAVETIDAHVGAIGAAVDEHLGGENCVLIYVSDHGDMAGERGLFWKSTLYEGSAGVPWVMRWPGHIRPGGICTPTSLLDLGPTLAGLVGATALPGARGRDLSPAVLAGREPANRDIVSTIADRRCGPSAAIRRGAWKLILHHGYPEAELYDLHEDPEERNDRGGDPACGMLVSGMKESLLARWDPGAIAARSELSKRRLDLMRSAHKAHEEEIPERWQADLDSLYLD